MLPICHECQQGRCKNCDGVADISIMGMEIRCECSDKSHDARRA